MRTDAQLADFLGVKANTIAGWKSRNSINYDLLFEKCDDLRADYLINGELPMLKEIELPSKTFDDPELVDFEHRVHDIVDTIKHGPFSQDLKIQLFESLLEMAYKETDELHE